MAVLTADQIHTDDFNPLLTDDPALVYKEYDELRSRCPVARTSKYNGYWSLLNYADVKKAANSSDLFISSVKAVVPSDPKGIRRPPLNTDGDVHTPYRRALDRTLKPARLRRLQQRLVFHAEMEFMKLVNRGGGDVCCDFGSLYVAKVETEWLNLEAAQGDLLAQTASKWVAAWRDLDATSVSYYSNIMYGIARDVIAERRINPRDAEEDPASSLLEETGPSGEPLDEEQLVGAIRQSLVVGTVAPPIILGSIVRHLSQHRGLQQQLREDPSLLPAATEEFIRLFSPYRGFSRTVAHNVELHGRLIRPGEPICLTYAAANRDPSVFGNPHDFDMHRHNISSHLGFGSGRHRCAGMPLARLVVQTALATILSLTSDFEVVEDKMAYAAMPELGAITCPVRITPA